MDKNKDIIEKGYAKIKETASSVIQKTKDMGSHLTESEEDKTFREHYDDIKSSLKKSWPSLTDNDLEKMRGQKDKIIIYLAEKFGETKESISHKITQMIRALKD